MTSTAAPSSAHAVNTLRLLGPMGANTIMAAELSRLSRRCGLAGYNKPQKVGPGALVVPFSPELARLCTVYHRTCARVLWDLYTSRAQRLEPLYDDILKLVQQDGRGYLRKDFSLSVTVRGHAHFAAGERQLVGTIKNALVDGARSHGVQARVEPEAPDIAFLVQVLPEGEAFVSIDLAGRPMNQRGYRVDGATAPLRENLAAMLVMLARHDSRQEVLIDPMAGTGTIAIEAACLARGLPVWTADRTPAADFLPELAPDPGGPPPGPLYADTQPCIVANELDPERAELLELHAQRAQVAPYVQIQQGDFRRLTRASVDTLCQTRGIQASSGLFLCNPPYGERLSEEDPVPLYRDLGRYCRKWLGFRTGVMVANPDFERAFGGRPRVKKPVSNGPLRGYFLLYDPENR